MVESTREFANKVERETRLYITSLDLPAHRLGHLVRSHWAVENCLHWVMDMTFRDDECRIRTNHAALTADGANVGGFAPVGEAGNSGR